MILAAWVVSGLLAGLAGRPRGARADLLRPAASASRCCYRSSPRSFSAASAACTAHWSEVSRSGLVMELSTWLDAPRRRRPHLQAGRRVRRSHSSSLLLRPQGPLRKSAGRLSTIASFGFWSFVGIVAGHLHDLRARACRCSSATRGSSTSARSRSWRIGAYTMAILVVKEDLNMWLAAGCGIVLAIARRHCCSGSRRCACGRTTSRSRRSPSARSSATSRRTRTAHRRLAGNDQPGRDRPGVSVRRRRGRASSARWNAISTSAATRRC